MNNNDSANARPLVLIIEDNEQLQELYRTMVMYAGLQSESITNGRVALERVQQEPAPQIIILDMYLPDEPGEEILRVIRDRGLPSKVIIATADANLAAQFADAADATMVKPVGVADMIRVFERLLEQYGKEKGEAT
jgi:DNA-binding NtrC family response regulator